MNKLLLLIPIILSLIIILMPSEVYAVNDNPHGTPTLTITADDTDYYAIDTTILTSIVENWPTDKDVKITIIMTHNDNGWLGKDKAYGFEYSKTFILTGNDKTPTYTVLTWHTESAKFRDLGFDGNADYKATIQFFDRNTGVLDEQYKSSTFFNRSTNNDPCSSAIHPGEDCP